MIESIEFTNFKALRKTTLPLAPFTLLLGPNGSGKSSVLQALQGIATIVKPNVETLAKGIDLGSIVAPWLAVPNVASFDSSVEIKMHLRAMAYSDTIEFEWAANQVRLKVDPRFVLSFREANVHFLANIQTFTLDPLAIACPGPVGSGPLGWNGSGLASVLDDLKDNHPEKWESLHGELRKWLPEYDYIQFTNPGHGHKGFVLRTKRGAHRIPADQLSQGTLVALALLTLAYLPNPPSLIGLEEIDRGLHPRLLRHLQDALYRLSYPESCGEKRPPIQVIATTHSPYLLDLYREHPEEVVLAEKEGLEVQFKQLSQFEHIDEILGDGPLSEIWYSGVLGGVSVKP